MSEPEFIHHADHDGISPAVFLCSIFQCFTKSLLKQQQQQNPFRFRPYPFQVFLFFGGAQAHELL